MENSNNKHLEELTELAEKLYTSAKASLKNGESLDETKKAISDFKKFLSQSGNLGDNIGNPFYWAWPESTFYEIPILQFLNHKNPNPKDVLDFISAMKSAKSDKRKK